MREWTKTCGISTKKLHELLRILESHGIVLSENDDSKLWLSAPILLELQDEWTGRTRKNSGFTPVYNRSDQKKKRTKTDTAHHRHPE